MSFKNTSKSGIVRSVIFQEGNTWYGVALEFNIVETGDSPQEVMLLLNEAIKGYVEAADKAKSSISVLNQEVEPEYEKLWHIGSENKEQAGEKGEKVYSISSQSIAALA